ncbi:MAG: OmpA family protein [Terracidiphilus sp.]
MKSLLIPAVFVALVVVAGCKHKVVAKAPAMAPPAAAATPTAQISASPSAVTSGDKVVLTWDSTNASHATISGLGTVSTSGSQTVTPSSSTTYTLTATGPGGSADATASVTVTAPPPAAAAPANTISEEELFQQNVHPIFFDYDKYNVRSDAQSTLTQDASFLQSHPDIKVVIGGYCDDRGSDEYNMALGQNRAQSAKTALVNAGIPVSRIRVISYGKEKQFCTDETESCWQQNRRDGFALDE